MSVRFRTIPAPPDAGRPPRTAVPPMPTLCRTASPAAPRVTVELDHMPGIAEVRIFNAAGEMVVQQAVRHAYLDCDFIRRCEQWIVEKDAELAAPGDPSPAGRLTLL